MKRGLTRNDWKGLWSVLWRLLLFAPFLQVLGLAALFLVIASVVIPPCYAIIAFASGDTFIGIGILIVWLVAVNLTRRVHRWLLDGIEFSGL